MRITVYLPKADIPAEVLAIITPVYGELDGITVFSEKGSGSLVYFVLDHAHGSIPTQLQSIKPFRVEAVETICPAAFAKINPGLYRLGRSKAEVQHDTEWEQDDLDERAEIITRTYIKVTGVSVKGVIAIISAIRSGKLQPYTNWIA